MARDPHKVYTLFGVFACRDPLTTFYPSPPPPSPDTHTESKPQTSSSLLARRHMVMWLSGPGAPLASPYNSLALLPAIFSLMSTRRTWAWHLDQRNAPALWSILPVSRCQGGLGFSRKNRSELCPRVPFLAKTMSSGLRLSTACYRAILSSEG